MILWDSDLTCRSGREAGLVRRRWVCASDPVARCGCALLGGAARVKDHLEEGFFGMGTRAASSPIPALRLFVAFAALLPLARSAEAVVGSFVVSIPGHDGQTPPSPEVLSQWFDWVRDNGIAVDRCGVRPNRGTFVVDLVEDEELELLEANGFTVLESSTVAATFPASVPEEYFDPDEVEAALAWIALEHRDIVRLTVIGTTAGGNPIHAIEISDQPGVEEDEPAILFNGQHHAREVVTSHIVMDVVETLTDGYLVDPEITDWVSNFKTVCVPMVNPDGVHHVFDTNPLWRRNRKVYPDCVGVDLNRNYPYQWGPGCGSSGSCNDTYRGPAPASERETLAMIALSEIYGFTMATSYHSYGRFIDYPYACADGTEGSLMPEHAVIDDLMHGIADAIATVDGIDYTVFSPTPLGGVNGDDTSWYYAHRGTYASIIEVGLSFAPSFDQAEGIIARNRAGWQHMYRRLSGSRIDVHVVDACSQEPLVSEVRLIEANGTNGELARWTRMPFGRWTFLTLPGETYTVQTEHPVYGQRSRTVVAGDSPVTVELPLLPSLPCAVGAIPTVSTWGAASLAVLLLVCGTLVLRRAGSQGLGRTYSDRS